MPNLRSSIKRVKVAAKKAKRNKPIRTAARTFVAGADMLIERSDSAAKEAVQRALQALDKAAAKGVIHKNNAARRKSRLVKKLNATIGE